MQTTVSGLLKAAVLGIATLGFAESAGAVVVQHADLAFVSGATFSGNISFADDYSSITGVNGVLTGYQDGIFGYTGLGSTVIDWVWADGLDYNPGFTQYATFLMNGNDYFDYSTWISFAYDFATAPPVALAPGGPGFGFQINVNYDDYLVSAALSAVPLPPALLLLASGIIGIASLGRMRNRLA